MRRNFSQRVLSLVLTLVMTASMFSTVALAKEPSASDTLALQATPTPAPEESASPEATPTPAPEESASPEATSTPAPQESASPEATSTPAPQESASPEATSTPAPQENTELAQTPVSLYDYTDANAVDSSGSAGYISGGVYTWADNNRSIVYPAGSTTAAASSKSGDAKRVLDGNTGTIWNASNITLDSYWFTLTASEPEYITGFQYVSRRDANISGVMTEYAVYVSMDGETFEPEPIKQGVLQGRLGTFFVHFDEPVLAKSIKIVSSCWAAAEMRLLYLPTDYDAMIQEAEAMYLAAEPGSEEGRWDVETRETYRNGLDSVKASAPETDDEVLVACKQVFALMKDLSRAQKWSTEDLAVEYNAAKRICDSATVGDDPLQWPQNEIDAFKTVLEYVGEVAGSAIQLRGDTDDALGTLEEARFAFEQAQVRPEMTYTGEIKGDTELSFILDGLTESHFQGNGASEDGSKYLELDYKTELWFDSLTFKIWFAVWQPIPEIRVQIKDTDGIWKDVDNGKKYTMNWTTNSSTSEVHTVTFDAPVQGTALRILFTKQTKNIYVIDELVVGMIVPEEDISISIDRDAIKLEESASAKLNAMVLPINTPNKTVKWTSSDPELVEVNADGLVTGLALPSGEDSHGVTITATTEYGDKSDTCTVTLVPKQATEEEKAATQQRINILQKLANASKEENYAPGALDAFIATIEKLNNALNSPNLTYGEIVRLNAECETARYNFEQNSYIPIHAVQELIDRVTGEGSSENFALEIIPVDPDTGRDVYEVDWKDGKVVLRGNDGVSLATAYNYYLKYYAFLDFAYVDDGAELWLPEKLPEVPEKVRIVFPYEYRHYSNENCEYKYTTLNYTREQWQHRIDWMAMNGFNMFLVDMGGHAIWMNAQEELNLPDAAIDELLHYTKDNGGNQYWGEIAISREAAKQEGDMAKFVVQTALSLGLEPEVRPFIGDVYFMFPNCHDDYYKKGRGEFVIDLPGTPFDGIKAYAAARWMGLPTGVYISPEVAPGASPEEAAKAKESFEKVSHAYYESLMETLGFNELGRTPQFVIKDVVHEQGFVVNHAAFPKSVVGDVVDDFLGINPDGVWMHTAWVYQNWIHNYIPSGHLLIIDLTADNRPKWTSTNEFNNTSWIWSMLYNFGGNTGLSGGLGQLPGKVLDAAERGTYMSGVSIAPEGGDTNPALYNLMAEMTWRSEEPNMEQWLKDYAKRRYGEENYAAAENEINAVWSMLYASVYKQFESFDGPFQTLTNAKPQLTGAKARRWGSNNKVYQSKEIIPIWKTMLDAAQAIGYDNLSEHFKYDLVDITRQALADISGDVYNKINPAYQNGNKEDALKYAGLMVDICEQMDKILSTTPKFMLGTRLAGARARGVTDADKDFYEEMERTFLTYWVLDDYDKGAGGGLVDYCNRHLSGLMTDYYGARWEIFYDELARAMESGTAYNQKTVDAEIKELSIAWANSHNEYPATGTGNPAAISQDILIHYTALIHELYPLDMEALQSLYEDNLDKNGDDYSKDSWAAFEQALTAAKDALDNAVTQQEIDAAYDALSKAVDGLVKVQKYAIHVDSNISNGTITTSTQLAESGEVVTLYIVADDGYQLVDGSLCVTGQKTGEKIPVKADNTFVMPDEEVSVMAMFEKTPDKTYTVTVNGIVWGKYAANETVVVSAPEAPDRQRFVRWTAKGIDLSDEDSTQNQITFVMPENAVELTALFENIPTGTPEPTPAPTDVPGPSPDPTEAPAPTDAPGGGQTTDPVIPQTGDTMPLAAVGFAMLLCVCTAAGIVVRKRSGR